MCDRESFARLRAQTEENLRTINELARRDAAQGEQIKTLFATTERQGRTIDTLTARLVMAVVGVLVLAVLALIFGALGKDGFNAVTKSAPAAAVAK